MVGGLILARGKGQGKKPTTVCGGTWCLRGAKARGKSPWKTWLTTVWGGGTLLARGKEDLAYYRFDLEGTRRALGYAWAFSARFMWLVFYNRR